MQLFGSGDSSIPDVGEILTFILLSRVFAICWLLTIFPILAGFFFFFTLHLLRFPWTLSSPQIPIIISHEVSRLFPQWENPLYNIHRHKYSMHYTLRTISYEENFHPRLSHSWVCVTQSPLQWLFPQVLNIMSAYLSEAGKIITVDFQFIQ